MFASLAIRFIENGLSKFSFSQMTAFATPLGIAIRLCHSFKLFALLATQQAVKNLAVQQGCEYSTVLRRSEEPEQSKYRIE